MHPSPVPLDQLAATLDLPGLLAQEGIYLRRGKALCPFHDNTATPALSIFEADGRWRYKCHSCGVRGDGLDWIAAREGITLAEAVLRVGGRNGYRIQASANPQPIIDRPIPVEVWRDSEWQAIVDDLVTEAESILWGRDGRSALDWLRDRGLADHTIRRFRLGFFPGQRSTRPIEILRNRDGDHGIFAPRGVTLPWLAPGASHRDEPDEPDPRPRWVGVNVRRLAAPDVSAPLPDRVEKCLMFRGSTRGYLYPWPDILPSLGALPMLLVEGEFDALIGAQEMGHLMHVATAGSASVRSLSLATRSALALVTWILLAFDHDKAGVAAVCEWMERFPHKSRRVLLPRGKDLNEFILGGGDARAWAATFPSYLG